MTRPVQGIRLEVLRSPGPSDIQQAADIFLLDCRARKLSTGTQDSYTRRLRYFLAWLSGEGVTRLAELTASHIRSYLVHEQERGMDDDTVITSFRVLRAWLNFCVNEELIAASPMRKVKAPILPKEILPAFAPEDVRKVLNACRTLRDTAMVLFLLDTGVRVSELVALNVGDLDPVSGTVQVKQGKGRKDGLVFLGAKAHKALKNYLRERPSAKPEEPLLLSENTGGRLTIWGLDRFCHRVGQRAYVAHCHAHTFRRTFALWSLGAGMNIYALQQIMGHSDLGILRRYLALVEEDLADAHRKHGAVDNML